jgi:DNA-binding transcriptional MerR regulator
MTTDTEVRPPAETPTAPAPSTPVSGNGTSSPSDGEEAKEAQEVEEVEEVLGIAEVAERFGLTAHTLRYYERIGLLDVPRDGGGRRQYSATDMARVHFITCLRKADMPMSRIQHYFELVEAGPHTEPERLALLEAHHQEVLGRLADLQTALATIEFKITMYGGELGDKLTDADAAAHTVAAAP